MKQKINRIEVANLFKSGMFPARIAEIHQVTRGRISIILHEEFSKKEYAKIVKRNKYKKELEQIKSKYEKNI